MINTKIKYMIKLAGGKPLALSKIADVSRQLVYRWLSQKTFAEDGKAAQAAKKLGLKKGWLNDAPFCKEWRVFESVDTMTDKQLIDDYGFDSETQIYMIKSHNMRIYYQVIAE